MMKTEKKLFPTLDIGSQSNAAPQPLPEAGARHERTLEAVGCRRLLGGVFTRSGRPMLERAVFHARGSHPSADLTSRPISSSSAFDWSKTPDIQRNP